MKRYASKAQGRPGLLGGLLLVLLLALLPVRMGHATNCSQASSQTVTLANVSVPSGTAVGTLLGSPSSATMTFTCNYVLADQGTITIQAGGTLAPLDPSNNSAGPGIIFATNVPGVALKVTGSPIQASSQSCLHCGPNSSAGYETGTVANPGFFGGTNSVSETFTLQLIKTGNIVPGTISAISLIPFWWYVPGYKPSISLNASLNLGAGTTVSVPACTVNAPANFTVTLPTIQTSALTATGMTAGRTGFRLSLNCPASTTVAISMQSSNPNASVTGLSNPGSGGAANVGVQLLDGSFNPVNVTAVAQAGIATSSAGTVLVPYYAQYYLIATPAGAGSVNATVTYTLTYP